MDRVAHDPLVFGLSVLNPCCSGFIRTLGGNLPRVGFIMLNGPILSFYKSKPTSNVSCLLVDLLSMI